MALDEDNMESNTSPVTLLSVSLYLVSLVCEIDWQYHLFQRVIEGSIELVRVWLLEQCPAHSKWSVSISYYY